MKIEARKRKAAVKFLRGLLKKERKKIKAVMKEKGKAWAIPYHFRWGMWLRNALRTEGYTERYMGIDNWDDHYVKLVEEAMA